MSNPETLKDTLCCGQPASIVADKKDGTDGFGVWCKVCGHARFDPIRENAIKIFLDEKPKKVINKPPVNNSQNQGVRKVNNNGNQNQLVISPRNIIEIFQREKAELNIMSSPILKGDQSAMDRFIHNNIERYPLTLVKGFDKIWACPEGQASIKKGIEDAFINCVELGVTGDLVPFGKTCVLIESVESFIFILTHGKNAPFAWVNIDCVYEGDDYKDGRTRKDGFFIDFHSFAKSRKKVVKVAVYGESTESGFVIGEMYDAERLLEKAEEHSQPFANYMKKIKAYEYQKSEGKVEKDRNGREFFTYFETVDSTTDPYFDRSVDFFNGAESRGELKKDNKGEYALQKLPTFEKKIYRSYIEGGTTETTIFLDTLKNPYAGADQPELLIKTAGKSFLRKYKKVRNTGAAMDEARTQKQGVNTAFDRADEQFKTVESEVID